MTRVKASAIINIKTIEGSTYCLLYTSSRLKPSVLNVLINNKNIYEVTCLSIGDLRTFITNLKLTKEQKEIDVYKRQSKSNV